MANATDTIQSEEKLRRIIREEVENVLQDFIIDPDAGLTLRDDFVERLKKSEAQIADGDLIPMEEIKTKYAET